MFLRKDERGQSLVEVALAMPVLILILVGILDLGRAYFTYVTIADAAAEGAAYGALHPGDTVEILERAVDASNGLVVLASDMVTVTHSGLDVGSPITVTVVYDYQIITPIVERFIPDGTLELKATVVQSVVAGGF